MKAARRLRKRPGAALMVVLLVMLAVMAIIVVASTTTLNARLIAKNSERSVVLYNTAQGAVEEIRNLVNMHPGDSLFFQDSGELMLESRVAVRDASGSVIPHVYRTTWAGPSFNNTGEFGIFGTIIAKVEDDYGNVVYHRGTVFQETFAKYAYFSNSEGGIYFGGGDQIFGPVHSNDNINIAASGVEFHDVVTTSKTIGGVSYGLFDRGYSQKVPKIQMPSTRLLTELKGLASSGHTMIVGDQTGGVGEATTRVEFVAIDLNNDGTAADADEGFMRVWQANPSTVANAQYTVAANTGDPAVGGIVTQTARGNDNCGVLFSPTQFNTVSYISNYAGTPVSGGNLTSAQTALATLNGKCYLGGDPNLDDQAGFVGRFMSGVPGKGAWLPSPLPPDPRLSALGRDDSLYLWPVNAVQNPDFKGVVFVDGKVAVSGTVRGRLTLATPYSIVIADDVTLQDGAAADCNDFLGLFAGQDVVIADNLMNSPQSLGMSPDVILHASLSQSEFVQATILALGSFTVQNYSSGVPAGEACEGTPAGRGCLYLTGGIIQGTRGPVGTLNASQTAGEYGYIKRYSFNTCGLTNPPPYFPTTGRFSANRSFEMDPVNVDIHPYYRIPTPVATMGLSKAPAPPRPAPAPAGPPRPAPAPRPPVPPPAPRPPRPPAPPPPPPPPPRPPAPPAPPPPPPAPPPPKPPPPPPRPPSPPPVPKPPPPPPPPPLPKI